MTVEQVSPAAGTSTLESSNCGNGVPILKTKQPSGAGKNHHPEVPIYDIRSSKDEMSLRDDIINGIKDSQEKTLPTIILYNSQGLKDFERITYNDEYYLTNAEIRVLEAYADRMAERIEDGAIVVELGSGNLRKVNILLNALERAQKNVNYFALDLSLPELKRTFHDLPNTSFKHVKCHGLHGTYDDGRKWLRTNEEVKDKPKCILWLGSSIGNFDKEDAINFVKTFSEEALRPGSKDTFLIGVDGCKDPAKVWHAYNDSEGITDDFIMNGLRNANQILGEEAFNVKDWTYRGEYDIENGRHQAFYVASKDINLGKNFENAVIKQGESIRVERSYKFTLSEAREIWTRAGLAEGAVWSASEEEHYLYMLYRPAFNFPLSPSVYAADAVPSVSDWNQLWVSWDMVISHMISEERALVKPIDLRNPYIFYFGHIPFFLDMQVSKAVGSEVSEKYWKIFERGIDPDVDNPEHCHRHSETPASWPSFEEVAGYKQKVRERIFNVYNSTEFEDVKVKRALWLGFEHECMHLETLFYMLIQDNELNPPKDVPKPDFETLAISEEEANAPEQWLEIPDSTIQLGLQNEEEQGGYFTWDNERPKRFAKVKALWSSPRPISNGEYAEYLEAKGIDSIPASWVSLEKSSHGVSGKNGTSFIKGKYVRTVFGPVELRLAANWPVIASYDELVGYAEWKGGRIPTHEEIHAIYDYIDIIKRTLESKKLAATFDAVNGHLSMNGVHITPPSENFKVTGVANGVPSGERELFSDLANGNVAFRCWHPKSVVGRLTGRGDIGAWEWSSSPLEKHEGFEPMPEYREYTADFFDTKHNVVMGGSWATHPRIAGRRSFVNWYQRNYPYAWCTARIVKDR